MNSISRLLAALLLVVSLPVAAQLNPNNARGFDPEKVYQTGDIDNVNVFNGNLIVTLPIGPKYPVSETLSYGLTLVNNGNPWDSRNNLDGSSAVPSRFANAGLGWQLSMGELVGPNAPSAHAINNAHYWVYAGPDGSERAFAAALHEEEEGTDYVAVSQANATGGSVIGYTRDSSYLRLKRLDPVRQFHGAPRPGEDPVYYFVPRYQIEFPDGTRHTFSGEEYETSTLVDSANRSYELDLHYRLTKIEDRSGNSVSVSYDLSSWTITDSRARTHTISFTSTTFYEFQTAQWAGLVSTVTVAAPHGKKLVYTFTYGDYEQASRPCSDTLVRNNMSKTTTMRYLNSIVATDEAAPATALASWSFDYDKLATTSGVPDCSYSAGHLKKITLPTGAKLEYTAGLRIYPTEKTGMPRDHDGPEPHQISTAVRTRKVTNIDGSTATWTYENVLQNLGQYSTTNEEGQVLRGNNRELVVRVTDPLNRTTAHYFNANALMIGADSCFLGDTPRDYGLPFTRTTGTNATSNLLLSQVFYPERCVTWDNSGTCPVANPCLNANDEPVQPVRRAYVRYEHDTPSPAADSRTGYNARVRASRTTFVDDTGCNGTPCYVQSSSSDFDGLGHYRTETRTSNFAAGVTSRTTTTGYNANSTAGTYSPNAASSPDDYMVARSSAWLLNVYKEVTSSDSTGSATSTVCFDSNGLVRRRRTHKTSAGTRDDLLAWFTYTNGNMTAEQYGGGDVNQLPSSFISTTGTPPDTCGTALPPAAEYTLVHGYSNGVRNTSSYSGAGFNHLDMTIDPSGQPSSSRDSAGVETTYQYDVFGRLVAVKPAGEAWTQYVYTNYASITSPASVKVRQWPNGATASDDGTPLTEKRVYVDGVGRVLQVKTRMPDGWSTVRMRYDGIGQKIAASMPEYRSTSAYESTFTPAHETTFAYDTFGRPTAATTPDGKTSVTAYTGTRKIARTVSIGGGASWSTAANKPIVVERPVTTAETYDAFGRLIAVDEKAEGTMTSTTSYEYDYADHLTSVVQGEQSRFFTYDARGLLASEQHPEKGAYGNGSVAYTKYDSRGHSTERTEGTIGLSFTFDAAERLTTVTNQMAAEVLKEFTFGTSGNAKGKLQTAKRHNRGGLGDVTVEESYTYDGLGGRVSNCTTTVASTATFKGATFTLDQTWNQFGNLDTLTYPTTTLASRSLTIANGYTNGLLTSVGGYGTITYQANGLIATVTHGSGGASVTESWVPDASGMSRPGAIEVTDANQSYWKYGDYAYDGAGNITMIGKATYDYDDVNRLRRHIVWTGSAYSATRYHYDRFGNQLGTAVEGCVNGHCFASSIHNELPIDRASNHVAGWNSIPQLTTNVAYAYHYDDAGSVTFDRTHTFAYDATSMMTSLTGGGRDERYLYTADDERVAVVRNVVGGYRTTWSIRGLDNRLLRTWADDNSTTTRQFTWSEDEIWRGGSLLASDSPTGFKHYHLDHLGSPRLVTDANGLRIGEQAFEPFGRGGSTDGGRLQFTAHERDIPESGSGLVLDYMHARYYDGGAGRFLSVDPKRTGRTQIPQAWNRYSYARNNPVKYIDPDGQDVYIAVTNIVVGATTVNSRPQGGGDRENVPAYKIVVMNESGDVSLFSGSRDTNYAGAAGDTRGNYGSDHETPPGSYFGRIRTDGKLGARIELSDTEGGDSVRAPNGTTRENLQIHVGPGCSQGCVLLTGGKDNRDNFIESVEKMQKAERDAGRTDKIHVVVMERNAVPGGDVADDDAFKKKNQ